MGESQQHLNRHHHGHRQLLHSPRLPVQPKTGGMKESGEIVEVQGGHILRSTGRKDRHSKVFTAKGPRDRRVRLSAHTAIQFYDVQDRLGYDRPSKAVDWLIKNAKAAIDELAGLPPKKASSDSQTPSIAEQSERPLQNSEDLSSSSFGFASGSILPHSLDSDAIADTIKSFFPISVAAGGSTSTATDFQSYSAEQGENLRLSLHSFQEPILLSGHSSAQHRSALFSHYDAGPSSWPEQNLRMIPWNVAPDAAPLHSLLGQGSHIAQRGPLQSSWPSNVRAWADSFAAVDPQPYEAGMNLAAPPVGSTLGGFPGFRIPPRIQGEDHDAMPSKRSSATASHQ